MQRSECPVTARDPLLQGSSLLKPSTSKLHLSALFFGLLALSTLEATVHTWPFHRTDIEIMQNMFLIVRCEIIMLKMIHYVAFPSTTFRMHHIF